MVKIFTILRMQILGIKCYRGDVHSLTKKVLHQEVKLCFSKKFEFNGAINQLNYVFKLPALHDFQILQVLCCFHQVRK